MFVCALQEKNEENAFMDAIMATSVIRHLMNFLKDKGTQHKIFAKCLISYT